MFSAFYQNNHSLLVVLRKTANGGLNSCYCCIVSRAKRGTPENEVHPYFLDRRAFLADRLLILGMAYAIIAF